MLSPEQQFLFEERKSIMLIDGNALEENVDALALLDVFEQLPYEEENQLNLDIDFIQAL
jgi:hypothetical protein